MITLLGDSVNYVSTESLHRTAHAAVIIGVHTDGTADLRVFNGFAQGTTDVEKVSQSDGAMPGSFFYPRGTKGAGQLAIALNNSSDTTVALVAGSDVAAAADNILIDQEYMTVTDATDPNNLIVTRAAGNSAEQAHAAGAIVKIGVTLPA